MPPLADSRVEKVRVGYVENRKVETWTTFFRTMLATYLRSGEFQSPGWKGPCGDQK